MRKRYKLIKDLPTFSAGQEFYIGREGALWLDTGTGRDICAYAAQTLQKFPNILKDWFEEISERPKTVDDLKEGDTWFFLNYDTRQYYVAETTNLICIEAFKQVGNAFLTREQSRVV